MRIFLLFKASWSTFLVVNKLIGVLLAHQMALARYALYLTKMLPYSTTQVVNTGNLIN
jgi:hypothetical protein